MEKGLEVSGHRATTLPNRRGPFPLSMCERWHSELSNTELPSHKLLPSGGPTRSDQQKRKFYLHALPVVLL